MIEYIIYLLKTITWQFCPILLKFDAMSEALILQKSANHSKDTERVNLMTNMRDSSLLRVKRSDSLSFWNDLFTFRGCFYAYMVKCYNYIKLRF